MTLCACGCGGEVNSGRFLQGHGRKGHTHTQRSKDAIAKGHIGTGAPLTAPTLCECGCGGYANPGNRYILGHNISTEKHRIDTINKIETNKSCPGYLGIYIAERVLSNVFKDVQIMPYGNMGFDIICNRDFKIDIKASIIINKSGWSFGINRNKIADYFLLVAFDNREDLNPMHLWMIPGDVINNLIHTSISKSTLDKWRQYELPLDKLLMCCDSLR